MGIRGYICVVALSLVVAGGARGQQQEVMLPPTTVSAVLRSMASRAGVVFVGSVQRIVPEGGVVEIDFAVQQPLAGVSGRTYVAREWAGRWMGAQQRYRVGQSAMFFLHAPGASGLSSPVDGMIGVVPLVQSGTKLGAMVDLRWVATRVNRAMGAPLAAADTGAMSLADAARVVSSWQVKTPEPVLYPMPGGVKRIPGVMQQGKGDAAGRDGVPQLLQAQERINAQR